MDSLQMWEFRRNASFQKYIFNKNVNLVIPNRPHYFFKSNTVQNVLKYLHFNFLLKSLRAKTVNQLGNNFIVFRLQQSLLSSYLYVYRKISSLLFLPLLISVEIKQRHLTAVKITNHETARTQRHLVTAGSKTTK